MKTGTLVEFAALFSWTLVTFVVVLFAPSYLYPVAIATFGAVIAASLLIAWAAEASETWISRGLALAIVAIVQTIPEYFVEGTIAWKAGIDPVQWLPNAIANFTGANRLLTGFGWPLIFFTVAIQRRRKREPGRHAITLRKEQSVEQVFMLGASLYYILILVEGKLTILDSFVLAGVFVVYMWMLARLPLGSGEREESLKGPSLELARIRTRRGRAAAVGGLFLFGALSFVLITDSFVVSLQHIAQMFLVGLLGSGAVFFTIQWIAPVLSEFPEKVTAFNWARRIRLAPVALLNFISSAVNELTALVALIPIVITISSGRIGFVPLEHQQWIEVFLTMAQSLYASVTLLDLEYDTQNAVVLLTLWIVSTAVIEARMVVAIAFIFFTVYEVVRSRGRMIAFDAFRATLREQIFRRTL